MLIHVIDECSCTLGIQLPDTRLLETSENQKLISLIIKLWEHLNAVRSSHGTKVNKSTYATYKKLNTL